jgi:CRP/FNR family transcriptional regulator, cyclic AMP receptor protein
MTDFDIFKDIGILKGLPDEQIKQLFDHCQRIEAQKGDIIMEEGEDRHSMFFFLDGEVVISNTMTMKATGRGGGFSEVEKSLVKLSAGMVSVLGEMSIIEELPRSATVKAFSTCVMYEISKSDFEAFTAKYPEIGSKIIYNIAKILCHRVRRSNSDIIKLSTALSIAVSKPV